MNKRIKGLVTWIMIASVLVVLASGLYSLTLFSVSSINIDQQGYEDPNHNWVGSYWSVVLTTDFDDKIAGFHVSNDEGTPDKNYAETVGGKTYSTTYNVGGKQLVVTSDIMVHVKPMQPYYERSLEIQQGSYVPLAYGRIFSVAGNPRTTDRANALPFQHYIFGSGSWEAHTPFEVWVYKDGVEIAYQVIDTVGKTGTYTLGNSQDGFVVVQDLGKLSTGYNAPVWQDILYFDKSHIFVRSPTADNYLKYDAGQSPSSVAGSSVGIVDAEAYSTFWYGTYRWMSDSSPAPFDLNSLPPGYYKEGSVAKPRTPPVVPDATGLTSIVEYLSNKDIPKVTYPSWLNPNLGQGHIESKIDGSDNWLRLYMPYGSLNSIVKLQISTELADTIVWTPQSAKFEITSFPDFGEILDSKSVPITVTCTQGYGSGTLSFTKNPSDTPLLIPPSVGIPSLNTGESYTTSINLLNLGTSTDRNFSIIAQATNSLGLLTDTKTAIGTLKQKTGASTFLHVITTFNDKGISGLPIVVEYSGTTKSGITDGGGAGLVTFDLQTSSTVSVKISYAGNNVYNSFERTVTVVGGSEKTVEVALSKLPINPEPFFDWTLIIIGVVASTSVVVGYYLWRKKR